MTQAQVYEKIKEVAENIGRKFQPEKIILFGSYAWGKPGPDSDVDLFIVKETKNTRETAREIDGALWGRTIPMDIVVYTPAGMEKALRRGDFFIKDIIEKGRLLYGER